MFEHNRVNVICLNTTMIFLIHVSQRQFGALPQLHRFHFWQYLNIWNEAGYLPPHSTDNHRDRMFMSHDGWLPTARDVLPPVCKAQHSLYTSLTIVIFSHVRLCNVMDCSTPGFPVLYHLPEFAQLMPIELMMPSNHLILCWPLLLLPSIFSSIRVFSNESVLHIRWPKVLSFNFSVSPSNEYSRLISFRIDWLDLLAVQGILKSLL